MATTNLPNLVGGNFIGLAQHNSGSMDYASTAIQFYYEILDTNDDGSTHVMAGIVLDGDTFFEQTLVSEEPEEWSPEFDPTLPDFDTTLISNRNYGINIELRSQNPYSSSSTLIFQQYRHTLPQLNSTYAHATTVVDGPYFTGGVFKRLIQGVYREWVVQEELDFVNGVTIFGTITISDPSTYSTYKTYSFSSNLNFSDSVSVVAPEEITDEEEFNIALYNPESGLEDIFVELVRSDDRTQVIIPRESIGADFTDYTHTFSWTEDNLSRLYAHLYDKSEDDFYVQVGYLRSGETTYIMGRAAKVHIKLGGDINPAITCSIDDTNEATLALTGSSKRLVRYHSNAVAQMTVEGVKGADITSRYIQTSEATLDADYYVFEGITSKTVNFVAHDTRGNSTITTDNEVVFLEYIKPTCNMTDIGLPTLDDTCRIYASGMYWDGDFGAAINTITLMYRYKSTSITDYVDWIEITDPEIEYISNGYNAVMDVDLPNHIDRFTIQIKVVDKLGEKESAERTVRAAPIFDWGETDFHFNIPVIIDGDLTVNGTITSDTPEEEVIEPADYIIEQGTRQTGSGNSLATWTFRKWNSGVYECWCRKHISTAVNTAWGNLYVSGSLTHTNLLWPGTFTDIPVATITIAPNASGAFLIASGSTSLTATNTGGYEIARGSALASAGNFYINYYGVGQWK